MIHRLLDARRRAKSHRQLEARLAAMRLGYTVYETTEDARRRRAGNALLVLAAVIGAAGILFGMLDPICETLDILLGAL